MTQRPSTVPVAHQSLLLFGLDAAMAFSQVPQDEQALHQPHPRRQALNASLTPMVRALDVHHLLARLETHLNRPAPPKCCHYPSHLRRYVGSEQIRIFHLTVRVAHDHHSDGTKPE